MKNLKNSFIAFVGLFLIVATFALVMPLLTQGQGSGIGGPRVLVVNPPEDPVPVTGTVTVANPVEVRQPFQENLSAGVDNITVPVGKRLVIEFFSGRAVSNCQLITVALQSTVEGRTIVHNFVPVLTGGTDQYVSSQETKLTADAGTVVSLGQSAVGPGPCNITNTASVSGYLVNMP